MQAGIRFAGDILHTVTLCRGTWEAVNKELCVCPLFHLTTHLKEINERKKVVSGTDPSPTTQNKTENNTNPQL